MSANTINWTGTKYSTDEQVVGTWIDGKPLYQKTYNFGTLPNKTYKDIPTGLTNVKVRSMKGYVYSSTAGVVGNLPSASISSVANQYALTVRENMTIIRITTGADATAYKECYITLQYTKTTD